MTRQQTHRVELNRVEERLRKLGYSVTRARQRDAYDFLVNGTIRVAVRVSHCGSYKHSVTIHGKRYEYDYGSWNFNFHRHGEWQTQYCDIFFCVALGAHGQTDFVIPARDISGPTFSLHRSPTLYKGRYAKHRDAMSVITSVVTEKRASA